MVVKAARIKINKINGPNLNIEKGAVSLDQETCCTEGIYNQDMCWAVVLFLLSSFSGFEYSRNSMRKQHPG